MNSKYNGRCKKCGASYRIGDAIFWSPQTKALCLNCGAPEKKETTHVNEAEIKAPAVRNTELGTPVVRGNESYYTVDWSDFKQC
jgi:phosphoribosylformylglycinamidine (FGAM) synthase-like enzyme